MAWLPSLLHRAVGEVPRGGKGPPVPIPACPQAALHPRWPFPWDAPRRWQLFCCSALPFHEFKLSQKKAALGPVPLQSLHYQILRLLSPFRDNLTGRRLGICRATTCKCRFYGASCKNGLKKAKCCSSILFFFLNFAARIKTGSAFSCP